MRVTPAGKRDAVAAVDGQALGIDGQVAVGFDHEACAFRVQHRALIGDGDGEAHLSVGARDHEAVFLLRMFNERGAGRPGGRLPGLPLSRCFVFHVLSSESAVVLDRGASPAVMYAACADGDAAEGPIDDGRSAGI
ncbi:MAG: hypothetical protein MZV70_53685 [Desulfobacterales bacterium]|nr:hypothetical protein [Desulfobacterales bacterium]